MFTIDRKHIRLQLRDKAWVKLGRFYQGIDETALTRLCTRLAPVKVYLSVLDLLLLEVAERKCKLHHPLPALPGEFVLDMDSPGYFGGTCVHDRSSVCFDYLERARWLTVRAVEAVDRYYRDIEIVFSGKRGFDVHVLDFDPPTGPV